jgi:hypothetical protein
MTGLDGILEAVRNSERERTQLRAALEKIQAVLADALRSPRQPAGCANFAMEVPQSGTRSPPHPLR